MESDLGLMMFMGSDEVAREYILLQLDTGFTKNSGRDGCLNLFRFF